MATGPFQPSTKHHSMLCMRTNESCNADSSLGTTMSEIGDFRESPESFFNFHTAELNSEMIGVSALNSAAASSSIIAGNLGKERTSTALLP